MGSTCCWSDLRREPTQWFNGGRVTPDHFRYELGGSNGLYKT